MGRPFYEGRASSRYERFGEKYRNFFDEYIDGNWILMILTLLAGYILIMTLGGILYCILPRSTKGWVCIDCLYELNAAAEPDRHIWEGNIIYRNPNWLKWSEERREKGNIIHLHTKEGSCSKHGKLLIPFEDSYNPVICSDDESDWFPTKFSFSIID